MSGVAGQADLERFRATIIGRIGLSFDDTKTGFLGTVLQRRLDQLRRPGTAYLDDLEHGALPGEIEALAIELTVGETYFFRHSEQFRALAEVALPERMRAGAAPGTLRLLSAGCASGEEAYSMAIVARAAVADPAWKVQVRAVDINRAALARAEAARYSAWALRDTSPEMQRTWFRAEGRDMRLDDSVRQAVRFEARNLANDDSVLWPPAGYDVIFCRNVLMYFAPAQMRLTVGRMARALVPGGFLFLGHAETLRGISDAFHLRHTHGTFYYQRKDASEPGLPPGRPEALRETPPAPAAARDDITWRAPPKPDPIAARPLGGWDPAPALDLLRRERFADALACLRRAPPAAGRDPDILLLEAALLAHSGRFSAADIACRRLLMLDGLNAGAHYLLALCREHEDDRDGAGEHDRIASYLDPAFAMPWLHLGLLARRGGDPPTARQALGQALILLQREDASRILLFGGGFGRAALSALCETALRECGGRV